MAETSFLVRLVVIEGRVQSVGYREFTRRAALRLNISGWVRNRSDGAVEAVLRGPATNVEMLIAELRQGPRFAIVETFSVFEHDEPIDGGDGGFVVRSTL